LEGSELKIWNKFRKGDEAAFEYIYSKYITALYNYGSRFTRDEKMIEDCIHDLYVDLWVKRNKLSPTDNIKPYLFKSLKRRLLRLLSKQTQSLDGEFNNEFMLEFSPEEIWIQNAALSDKYERLNQTLQQLTPKQREVIFLKYFEKLSYQEIADVMKVEVKAVYKLSARAIDNLKSVFTLFVIISLKNTL